MRPRKYLKRIEVWKYGKEPDGYSGEVAIPGEKIDESWCNVRPINIDKQIQYGLDETRYAAILTLRKRCDLDYSQNDIYFIYEGREYTPSRITEKSRYEFEMLISGNY